MSESKHVRFWVLILFCFITNFDYLGTVFAYGQTGSGKTFTMRGDEAKPGIIPLTVDHLLASFDAQPEREFMIGMIYIEIYNEKIKNLLSSEERKLFVKEETDTGNFEIQVKIVFRLTLFSQNFSRGLSSALSLREQKS